MKTLKAKLKKFSLLAFVLPFSKVSAARPMIAPVFKRARDLQCDQAQALVENVGLVHLATTSEDIFDLYVFDRDDCAIGTSGERVLIPTMDSPACLVGWRCVPN